MGAISRQLSNQATPERRGTESVIRRKRRCSSAKMRYPCPWPSPPHHLPAVISLSPSQGLGFHLRAASALHMLTDGRNVHQDAPLASLLLLSHFPLESWGLTSEGPVFNTQQQHLQCSSLCGLGSTAHLTELVSTPLQLCTLHSQTSAACWDLGACGSLSAVQCHTLCDR